MNKGYKEYMKNCWKEAEDVANEVGCTSNEVVGIIFDKICQPYYFWNKKE